MTQPPHDRDLGAPDSPPASRPGPLPAYPGAPGGPSAGSGGGYGSPQAGYGGGYPGSPQPGYGGPGYPPGFPPPTEGTAIAALVLAFVLAPVGLVLGFVALSKIRRSGARGRGMAIAAVVVSAVALLVTALAVVALVVFSTGSEPQDITEPRSISADAIEAGHCSDLLDIDEAGARVPVLPCDQAHDTEIVAEVGDGQLIAGTIDIQAKLAPECQEIVDRLAGEDAARLEVYIFPIVPEDPDRRFSTRYLCAASSPVSTITGSYVLGDAELG